jgi:hypothetical protein
MKISFNLDFTCPICEQKVPGSIWRFILGTIKCKGCGFLKNQIKITRQRERISLLVPPDSLPTIIIIIPILFVMLLVAYELLFTKGGSVLFILIIGFITAFLVIEISRQKFLGLIDRFFYSKEIILQGKTILIRLIEDNKGKIINIDCSAVNEPCVYMGSSVSIETAKKKINLGLGWKPKVKREVRAFIEDFLSQQSKNKKDCPQTGLEVKKQIREQGYATIKDNYLSTSTINVKVTEEKGRVFIKTSALWNPQKWIQFLAVSMVVIFLFTFLWRLGIKFGIGISIGIGFLAYMMDITLELQRDKVVIFYRLFGLISWDREIPVSEIFDVDHSWLGYSAIFTLRRSFRISHISGRESRDKLSGFIRKQLRDYSGWQPKNRCEMEKNRQHPSRLVFPPSGILVLDEIGFPIPVIIIMGIFLVPASVLVEVLIMEGIKQFIYISEKFSTDILPVFLVLHILLVVWIGIKLMKSKAVVTLDGAFLVVRRQIWKWFSIRSRFPLKKEPILIQIKKSETGQVNAILIQQGLKKVCVGSTLPWDELHRIKSTIEKMITQ